MRLQKASERASCADDGLLAQSLLGLLLQLLTFPLLQMFMLGMSNEMVVDKHYQNYQTKYTNDTQHDDHFCSPLSTVRDRNIITNNENTVQNMNLCNSDSLAKNSPAKYPTRIIFAKSPRSFAIESLDLELSHFIFKLKCSIDFNICQVIRKRDCFALLAMTGADA